MKPYYESPDLHHRVYHCDWRDLVIDLEIEVIVTDPPYGIQYLSGWDSELPREISGDDDTKERDEMLHRFSEGPALLFGSWRCPRPCGTKMVLIWDTGGALGMGDLSLPWKPSHQEIYVIGTGFTGKRTSDVLRFPPVQSMAKNGRLHPHEKPVGLMKALIDKCPMGMIFDPFCGAGSTLVAAKQLGREAVGCEIEERYCDIAAKRLAQEVLDFA